MSAHMDWDSFAACLDAGATLADFFPEVSSAAAHPDGHCGGRSGRPEPSRSSGDGGDAASAATRPSGSQSLGTKQLHEQLVGGGAGRAARLFYSRIDCCAYGLPAADLRRAVPPFAERQPQLLPPEIEEMAVSSFNFVDLEAVLQEQDAATAGDTAAAAAAATTTTAAGKDGSVAVNGNEEAGHAAANVRRFSPFLSKAKSLGEKLQLLVSEDGGGGVVDDDADADDRAAGGGVVAVRALWVRQQGHTFAAHSEAEWAAALAALVDQCLAARHLHLPGPPQATSPATAPGATAAHAGARGGRADRAGHVDGDGDGTGSHPAEAATTAATAVSWCSVLHMLLREVQPPKGVASACLGMLPLLTACFVLRDGATGGDGADGSCRELFAAADASPADDAAGTAAAASRPRLRPAFAAELPLLVTGYRAFFGAVLRAAGALQLPPNAFQERLKLLHLSCCARRRHHSNEQAAAAGSSTDDEGDDTRMDSHAEALLCAVVPLLLHELRQLYATSTRH